MPITCSTQIVPLDQEAFHALDKRVMKHAFAIHNQLGRFFDEEIYQAELTRRCIADGLGVKREVMVCVEYKTFRKEYFLDMLMLSGAIYELKCLAHLMGRNESQLINYLLLTGIQHGKLINFRPSSVEARFISTQLTQEVRKKFCVDTASWVPRNEQDEHFNGFLLGMLTEWGAFLSKELYRDALIHFFGGEERVVCPVDVISEGIVIGSKKLCLLDSKTAFHVSAISQRSSLYELHLHRLLAHTKLRVIQWINFDQNHIRLKTLCS